MIHSTLSNLSYGTSTFCYHNLKFRHGVFRRAIPRDYINLERDVEDVMMSLSGTLICLSRPSQL